MKVINNILIEFEGIDGIGKTSLINEIYNYLRDVKLMFNIEIMKAPYNHYKNYGFLKDMMSFSSEDGLENEKIKEEFIKQMLKNMKYRENILRKNLKFNLVLSDRGYLSTLVYNSLGIYQKKLEDEKINSIFSKRIKPDFTFVLLGKPIRTNSLNKFDDFIIKNYETINKCYLSFLVKNYSSEEYEFINVNDHFFKNYQIIIKSIAEKICEIAISNIENKIRKGE